MLITLQESKAGAGNRAIQKVVPPTKDTLPPGYKDGERQHYELVTWLEGVALHCSTRDPAMPVIPFSSSIKQKFKCQKKKIYAWIASEISASATHC